MGVGVRGGWTRSGDLVLGKLKSSPPGTGSWLEEFLGGIAGGSFVVFETAQVQQPLAFCNVFLILIASFSLKD